MFNANPNYYLIDPMAWPIPELERLAQEMLKWTQEKERFILGEFAAENGFHRKSYPHFCKRSEKFRQAYLIATQRQENDIVKNSLERKYDGSFARAVLKSYDYENWSDEQKITVNNKSFSININVDNKHRIESSNGLSSEISNKIDDAHIGLESDESDENDEDDEDEGDNDVPVPQPTRGSGFYAQP